MKKTFRDRLQYWFDNHMAAGTKGMAWMLSGGMILVVSLLAGAVMITGVRKEGGVLSAFWDSLAVTINAEMPYSGDGETGYVVLMAISAMVGLLFTSVLIGIVNNGIEEKLTMLRKGNSMVLEREHTVILGFVPGEYELISQLILAAEGKKTCLVIGENRDRGEMEEAIRENVEVPSNVRIICRKVDICDPNALKICSLKTCRNIVVTPIEDGRTLKAILAVSSILGEQEKERIHIVAAVLRDEYMLPANIAGKNGILMVQTHDVAARVISHACTQPGLSDAFTDIFNFEGSELYLWKPTANEGKTFAYLMSQVEGGVPLGICRKGIISLNPGADEILEREDSLLLFTENREKPCFMEGPELPLSTFDGKMVKMPDGEVLIIGWNEVLDTVLQELPVSIPRVVVAGIDEGKEEVIHTYVRKYPERDISIITGDILAEGRLEKLVSRAEYVVLLSDHTMDEETADIQSIRILLRLRDIKSRLDLSFAITAELRRERNRNLVMEDDPADFIVASNMSSMILAQLTENPMLYGVFQELLSNVGNELYLKTAAALGCEESKKTVAEFRMGALSRGYLLLGYIKQEGKKREVCLNPPLGKTVILRPEDQLIVIGRQ